MVMGVDSSICMAGRLFLIFTSGTACDSKPHKHIQRKNTHNVQDSNMFHATAAAHDNVT